MTSSKHSENALLALLLGFAMAALASSSTGAPAPSCDTAPRVCLDTLTELSVDALRKRSYDSELQLLQTADHPIREQTYLIGYQSDGLSLYARLDMPTSPQPRSGYPIIVVAPGWIARDQAPGWDFGIDGTSSYSPVIDSFADSGFAVVTAGYRGRGTVAGVAADGIDYRDAWGNGSYISPVFYAIDVLNLIAGLDTLEPLDWGEWLSGDSPGPRFDLDRVSLWGHSQGGDAGLTALAIAGHNPGYPQKILAASLWAGNIPDRFTQADTFGPMASTTQAFMSGDGSWTGSAQGKNGELNPEFIFPWPADWIATLDTRSDEWTWQAQQWSVTTVAEARRIKYREMYNALNHYVRDMAEVDFSLTLDTAGKSRVQHAAAVAAAMPTLGGFNFPQYIAVPLALHISDRDYYSIPAWNHDLAERINGNGGHARVYVYPGNTHSLQRSQHRWFSPEGTAPGAPIALERDRQLFSSAAFAE